MMAVICRGLTQPTVTSSAVVREPKPLGPAVPARYLSEVEVSMSHWYCSNRPQERERSLA
jgi:hypothetical protein